MFFFFVTIVESILISTKENILLKSMFLVRA